MTAARCLLQALAFDMNDTRKRIRLLRGYLRECASPQAASALQRLEEERGNTVGARWASSRGFVLKVRSADKPVPLASDRNDEWFLARILGADPVIVEMYAPEAPIRNESASSAAEEANRQHERAKQRPSAAAFQRLGLAHERAGQIKAALRAYHRAAKLAHSARRKALYESLVHKIRILQDV
jgi:hypothetical protein